LNVPQMTVPGALTTRGPTTIGGSSLISGNDTDPSGWTDCPPPGSAKPGIVNPDADQLETNGNGCNNFACVSGNPPVDEDPIAADTNTYFKYGDIDWSDLTATAKRVGPGSIQSIEPSYRADGSCDTANPKNWGDPGRNAASPGTCERYFPVIYAPGDLTINSGTAQGVLLVEGNLDVQGGFKFFGPVIVRGRLKTSGTGGHFTGGVMAADVQLDGNTVTGNAVITFSGCAIAKALRGSALPVVASGRAWVELYR
jgi:hypothetical protein